MHFPVKKSPAFMLAGAVAALVYSGVAPAQTPNGPANVQAYKPPGETIDAEAFARAAAELKSRNYSEAAELLRGPADAGNSEAQNMLGALYQGGLGVPRDINEAIRLYVAAAQAGNRDAMANLGGVYESGNWGIPQDVAEARKWYKLAARLGHKEAKAELERIAILSAPRKMAAKKTTAMAPPSGNVSADEALSRYRAAKAHSDYSAEFRWAQTAADAGSPEGKYLLSTDYDNGIGVEKDADKGLALLREAADGGYYRAEYLLAYKSFIGLGMPRDVESARALGEKAFQQALPLAQSGDKDAQWLVGRMYGDGLGGVQDPVEGRKWLAKAVAQARVAAEKGDAQAAAVMEFAYRAGWGVQQDSTQANAWLKKEIEYGWPPALARKY